MKLGPGSRLDAYELLQTLGAGGMGEVWLATEVRLGRRVALKLLPTDLTRDSVRVSRFEQEARAASALSHPNVCTILALGATSTGQHYIAMEYVDGETLRRRIAAGRLTIGESLDIAIQIASALVAAHASGIIHRDIKPENVAVRPDGLVKVLDFGLAKLAPVSPVAGDGDLTRASGSTMPGTILGTLAYMSPEQARGEDVDARTDVWALGCVLYEMIAGRAPFAGATSSDVLVAVLASEPAPIADAEPNAPVELQRILTKTLRKDREQRCQTARDLLVDLKGLRRELEPATPSSQSHRSAADASRAGDRGGPIRATAWFARHRWWTVASLAIGAAVMAAVVWSRFAPPTAGPAPMRVVPFTSFPGRELHPAFSPDGRQIAFAWEGEDRGNLDIYVKLIGEGRPLRLTTDPRPEFSPAWSPDGGHIAFYRAGAGAPVARSGEIVLVPALGGAERILVRSSESWWPAVDNRPGEPVSAGGEQRIVSWFSGGRALAIVGRRSTESPAAVFRFSLDTGELTPLTNPPRGTWGDITAVVSPDAKRLAFTRSEMSYWVVPTLFWAPITDGPVGKAQRVPVGSSMVHSLAWEPDGRRLVASTSEGLRRVTLPGGTSELLPVSGYRFAQPAVSAHGDRLAFVEASWDLDIWRVRGPEPSDAARTESHSLIASTWLDTNPAYSPSGTRIAFSSARSGSMQTWICEADGSNPVQLTRFTHGTGTPRWSPDGRFLAFDSVETGDGDIFVVPVDGGAPRRVTQNDAHEQRPSWSRDGRWIYFESDRTGTFQIWRMPLDGGPAVQITTAGGADAAESPDGQHVYFTKDRQLGIWRAPITGGAEALVADRGTSNLWAMYDKGLCILEADVEDGPRIDCLDFARQQWSTVARLPEGTRVNRSGPSLSVSADGAWVLYVRREREESDIMLVENFR
jgi:eukaryotic-like serine/threonine-protein kinase